MLTYMQLLNLALWTIALTIIAIAVLKLAYNAVRNLLATRQAEKIKELERRFDQLDNRCNTYHDELAKRLDKMEEDYYNVVHGNKQDSVI